METNLLDHKADLWHSAFIPSGVVNCDVSELSETEEDVLIINAREARRSGPDDALERAPPAWEIITHYAVTSFVVAVIAVTIALALVSVMFPLALVSPNVPGVPGEMGTH
jgi:hypothetical protein